MERKIYIPTMIALLVAAAILQAAPPSGDLLGLAWLGLFGTQMTLGFYRAQYCRRSGWLGLLTLIPFGWVYLACLGRRPEDRPQVRIEPTVRTTSNLALWSELPPA